jgi:deoxyribodipyrimidine photo-lyase
MISLVILQNDLRIIDNPALFYAGKNDRDIVVVYWQEEPIGQASLVWLQNAFNDLKNSLEFYNIPLFYCPNSSFEHMVKQINQTEPIEVIYHNDIDRLPNLSLFKEIKTEILYPNWLYYQAKDYRQFKICAALWKYSISNLEKPKAVLPVNLKKQKPLNILIDKIRQNNLFVFPKIDQRPWVEQTIKNWNPSEKGAQNRWNDFRKNIIYDYNQGRDLPYKDNTSKLSPYLRFGQISIRQIWQDLTDINDNFMGFEKFINEIAWREFAYHLQQLNQDINSKPLNKKFTNFPWIENETFMLAWQQGKTGYPIIDAGMRQLWHTGWMHNRVRMIVASFLVKNLLIPWQKGERWFFDTLFDGDRYANTMNWQWVAGCGTDTAPYFRIFNPTLQSQKFDPLGDYIKTWVPELRKISINDINAPWKLGIFRPKEYPSPIVDLQKSRQKALEAYDLIKS